MPTWSFNADPAGNLWISALVAALPIIFLGIALAVLKMKGYIAAILTIIFASLIAVFFYGIPASIVVSTDILGAVTGLAPIGYVVLMGVFLYNLTVEAGQFEIIKYSISKVSDDQRIQALLVAFSFSAFMEGAAGFGTPVAIAAAMLIGIGFPPLYAAGLALVANSIPVAFGSIGIPITTAGQVSGIHADLIGAMVGRQLPILTLIIPFWVVMIMGGWKAAKGVIPALAVSGISFALAQFIASNYMGYQSTDLIASMFSIVALVVLMMFWKPKDKWSFEGTTAAAAVSDKHYTGGQILRAWSPYIITSIVILIWGRDWFKNLFPASKANAPGNWWEIKFNMAGVHNAILVDGKAQAATYVLNWVTASGTAIFVACVLAAIVLAMGPQRFLGVLGRTFKQLALPLLSIACFLAYAELSRRSGMGNSMGNALAKTGVLFAFFAPFIGYIGVFLTGSDTSTNALFAKLQAFTAKQVHISDVLAVAANSSGGCAAKMISPQSIAVGAGATNMAGQEGNILRFTLKHSLIFVTLIGVITWLQAYVFTGMIPHS
ncbi:L-lactate permease [Effusibacillus dendaii]|uniref:L-lactate permease n=1 Tax=Effusibacillus dendaii TaxID=2743772 RepID=A0A7I8DDE3_9BACL|nr:lactate permease LctP family transporter [Effusibacillus dendaii]BCJ88047.1 L-lactate permease [Effusibacillus dendaii]